MVTNDEEQLCLSPSLIQQYLPPTCSPALCPRLSYRHYCSIRVEVFFGSIQLCRALGSRTLCSVELCIQTRFCESKPLLRYSSLLKLTQNCICWAKLFTRRATVHPVTHTGGWQVATCSSVATIHTHALTLMHYQFSSLPKDTLTCRLQGPGIEPLTDWWYYHLTKKAAGAFTDLRNVLIKRIIFCPPAAAVISLMLVALFLFVAVFSVMQLGRWFKRQPIKLWLERSYSEEQQQTYRKWLLLNKSETWRWFKGHVLRLNEGDDVWVSVHK